MRILIVVGFAGLLLVKALTPATAGDLDANKQLVRDYIDNAINKRQPAAAERYFAANYIEHNPHLPAGIAGKKRFIAAVLKGFSDYHGEITDIVAEGDEVVTRTLWTGTQDGPFLGRPATGNKVQFATSDFYRIDNGKIVEHWDVVDSLTRAIALGLVSPPK
jgi:predicted SnoaL-like aldol condensation-catalyzing enzyme